MTLATRLIAHEDCVDWNSPRVPTAHGGHLGIRYDAECNHDRD